jgi:hypothetical protein
MCDRSQVAEQALDARARRAAHRVGLVARKSRWRANSIDNYGGQAMNRQKRRAAAAYRRKWKSGELGVGTVIHTQTVRLRETGEFYWFETDGAANMTGFTVSLDPTELKNFHGPFKTEAEVAESQRLILLGPQCEVREGGVWDSAWDKPQ